MCINGFNDLNTSLCDFDFYPDKLNAPKLDFLILNEKKIIIKKYNILFFFQKYMLSLFSI